MTKYKSSKYFLIFGIIIIILFYNVYYKKSKNIIDINSFNIISQTKEELNFPLAYSIMVYRDPDQFYRLFKAIYRPGNAYCIHVDHKSPHELHDIVHNLSTKFNNIILPSKFINVIHSQFSVLESEILCIKALLGIEAFNKEHIDRSRKIKWKYLINLTGQEWPLKVNLEIVRILKSLNGANLIEKLKPNLSRFKNIKIPNNIQLWKGAIHIIATRKFIEFSVTNKKALEFYSILPDTIIPDESYFATINNDHSFKAPGGYSGNLVRDPIKLPFISRHKIWKGEGSCHGHWLREICIFSLEDIPLMISIQNPHLFANKFVKNYNDNVLDYMEKWFYDRQRIVYGNTAVNPFINLTFYQNLEVTRNHF